MRDSFPVRKTGGWREGVGVEDRKRGEEEEEEGRSRKGEEEEEEGRSERECLVFLPFLF